MSPEATKISLTSVKDSLSFALDPGLAIVGSWSIVLGARSSRVFAVALVAGIGVCFASILEQAVDTMRSNAKITARMDAIL